LGDDGVVLLKYHLIPGHLKILIVARLRVPGMQVQSGASPSAALFF
jgi:hypothetical protein